MKKRAGRMVACALMALATQACEEVEQVQDRFRDLTPHEAYQESLAAAGLSETALGREWLGASRESIEAAVPVSLPFEEEGFIASEDPGAQAYRITIGRGQKLTATVALESEEVTRVFIDLFRVPADPGDPFRPVLSIDSLPGGFEHEPWRGGEYILRVQPELLRGGRYRVALRLDAQLAFPVEGHGMPSVQSFFGAARDGGQRSHHGVDIFARRGTPVVATSAGTVNRVDVTTLGGKVVWLRDPVRNANIYYAHLDSQYVADGDRVEVGDTLGFVGNTGNAITTPPHLHFGIYRRGEGPVDPAPFLRPPPGTLVAMLEDLDRLGTWVRVANAGVRLREAPGPRGPILRELDEHTAVRVLGASGQYFRVRLPDGEFGYLAANLTDPVTAPVGSRRVASGVPVRAAPRRTSPAVERTAAAVEVPVLGRFEEFVLVRLESGATGWLSTATAQEQ